MKYEITDPQDVYKKIIREELDRFIELRFAFELALKVISYTEQDYDMYAKDAPEYDLLNYYKDKFGVKNDK